MHAVMKYLVVLCLFLRIQSIWGLLQLNDTEVFQSPSSCKFFILIRFGIIISFFSIEGFCIRSCKMDPECVIAYFKPRVDAFLCKLIKDSTVMLEFHKGIHYYCKGRNLKLYEKINNSCYVLIGCLVSKENINEAIQKGIIRSKNWALKKPVKASSYYSKLKDNCMEIPI